MNAGRGDLTPDVLAALLRKYRLLAHWRRAKDLAVAPSGDATDVASPAAMRALAEEFPGALRELDLLGLPELERRAACLEAAATDFRDRGSHRQSAPDRQGDHINDDRRAEGDRRANRDVQAEGDGKRDVDGSRDRDRASDDQPKGDDWIAWIASYHTLMRLALASRRPSPSAAAPSPLADAIFLRDVQRPPGGRLSVAVLEALARRFQRTPRELRSVLFPPRR